MPTVKVILDAGQSNEMGYGNRGQLAPVPTWAQTAANGWEGHPTRSSDSGVEYPRPTPVNAPCKYAEYYGKPLSGPAGEWGAYLGQSLVKADAYHPSDFMEERGSYGPELSLHFRWMADHPGDLLAWVKVAEGGTSIDDWSPPTGRMWLLFQSELNKAKGRLQADLADHGVGYEFAAFIFGHGESGCSTVWPYLNDPDAYARKLRALLAAVRSATRPDLPCVVKGIGSQMFTPAVIGTANSGIDTPENRLAATHHRLDQQRAVAADPGNVFVDRENLPTLQSGSAENWFHLTGGGVLADGERTYAALTGYTPPPPPPPLATTFNGSPVSGWVVKLNGVAVGGDGDTLAVTG